MQKMTLSPCYKELMGTVTKSVLLVDDDTDYLWLFKRFLMGEGLMVHCAANGEEALSLLQDTGIHLMITDLDMPGMDGIELARNALEVRPNLPIILSTGTIANITQTAEDAGIKVIIYKPLDPQQILVTVMNLLKK